MIWTLLGSCRSFKCLVLRTLTVSSTFLIDGLQDLKKLALIRYYVLVHIDMYIIASCHSPDGQFSVSRSKRHTVLSISCLNMFGHSVAKRYFPVRWTIVWKNYWNSLLPLYILHSKILQLYVKCVCVCVFIPGLLSCMLMSWKMKEICGFWFQTTWRVWLYRGASSVASSGNLFRPTLDACVTAYVAFELKPTVGRHKMLRLFLSWRTWASPNLKFNTILHLFQ